uniref:ATP synthase complex subunit 8 n=1 Tax=Troglophilus neglectus TaxID=552514 RepID=B6DEE2_TRONE|nr:ATP synthase F0 subunit 8 [Troglophilus neglectus]ACG59338.1 ATP synthase F0 subunit 8 [Troglophilus neglectus]
MPQMAPLSWFILFMIFSATLIMFCMMNYFISSSTPKSSKHSILINSLNWKW